MTTRRSSSVAIGLGVRMTAAVATALLTAGSTTKANAAEPAATTAKAGTPAGAEERPMIFGINRVGADATLHDPPGYQEDLYRQLQYIGNTVVRLAASPRDIEHERGKRDWKAFEEDLALSIKYNMEPMVLVVNTPAWASPTGEDTHLYPYKTELLPEFASFCEDLATRTRGKVRLFQIWNEQNGCSWHFHDGFNHADEYVPVLRVAYKALKKANPDCIVSLGSLDDAEGHAPIFMRKTYEEIARQCPGERIFDAVSDHPYSDDPATMKRKLDAIRKIMIDHGDGDLPIWITEYGWNTGNTPLDVQAKRLRDVLSAMQQPEWSFLKISVYLSLADFEGDLDGFGVCDSNLRPRPAFYAFQGEPRWGRSPAHTVKWHFGGGGTLDVSWETVLETEGELVCVDAQGRETSRHKTPLSRKHRVKLEELPAATDCAFRLRTHRRGRDGQALDTESPVYRVRMPGPQVYNGDFEEGFFGGIGKGWQIDGNAFCTDLSVLPDAPHPKGKHTQSIFANGGRQKLDSTMWTACVTRAGGRYELSGVWCGRAKGSEAPAQARVGFDLTGGDNPTGRAVLWSEWTDLEPRWRPFRQEVRTTGDLTGLFIQCRTPGQHAKGQAQFHVDDIQLTPR